MRRIILISILIVVFYNINAQKAKTIIVRGTSIKEITPEKVELLLTYSTYDNVRNKDIEEEQEAYLLETIKGFNIPKQNLIVDNIYASGWNTSMSKTGNTRMSLRKDYRLIVNNPLIIDDLIPKLIRTGADNIYICNLESSKIDSIKKVTISTAIDNAKTKALVISNNIGVQLGNPISITEIFPDKSIQTNPYLNKYSSTNIRGSASFQDSDTESMNMRKIKISTTFEVEYEIK